MGMFTVKGPRSQPDELEETQEAILEGMIDTIPEDETDEPEESSELETGLRLQEPAEEVPPLAATQEAVLPVDTTQGGVPPVDTTQQAVAPLDPTPAEVPPPEIPPEDEVPEEEYEVAHSNLKDPLTQAREYLFSVLISQKFGIVSAQHIVAIFNDFVGWTSDQIPLAMLTPGDDFNWTGQRAAIPKWAPLSDIAMRLHSCPCSEAECERTISAQRLILTSKRFNSKQRTNSARLTLMKTGPE
jgi:hypothetical protein